MKARNVLVTLVMFLAMSVLAGDVLAQAVVAPDTTTPVARENDWWGTRHQAMNDRVKQGNVDLIMIGDSITDFWERAGKEIWAKYYAHRNAVNLGIRGDRTQHVLWRLANGNLDGISPKLAVLMIGTNNSGANTPDEIAEGVEAIVTLLRERLPETKVLVLAIFPRGPNDDDPKRQTNQKANERIAKLADGDMVLYMDLADRFLKPDGTLTKDVMPDLLHLTPASYRVWAEAIEPVVAEVLGDARIDEQGFTPLFDGKTLTGWRQAGGEATYRVEDGQIVGEVGPGHNSFLCTEKTFADFVLKLDVKLDVPGNSGIQFRSHQREDGVVFGYQCEIDPSDRAWSGGIYDESRRGWLDTLENRPEARSALKKDAWNEFVIEAVGPSIKTWINGVPCAELTDTADAEGFIALQVHAGDQGKIRWRNIRLKEIPAK